MELSQIRQAIADARNERAVLEDAFTKALARVTPTGRRSTFDLYIPRLHAVGERIRELSNQLPETA